MTPTRSAASSIRSAPPRSAIPTGLQQSLEDVDWDEVAPLFDANVRRDARPRDGGPRCGCRWRRARRRLPVAPLHARCHERSLFGYEASRRGSSRTSVQAATAQRGPTSQPCSFDASATLCDRAERRPRLHHKIGLFLTSYTAFRASFLPSARWNVVARSDQALRALGEVVTRCARCSSRRTPHRAASTR